MSLISDLNGTACSAQPCFDVADTIARIDLRPPPEVGLPGNGLVTIAVPLCVDHAHLLRMGAELVDLDEGL